MRYKLLLFFVPLLFWFAINEANLSYARSIDATYMGHINRNPDTRGYTSQIENYMAGHGFTFDPKNDPEMAVRRTPGYPLFFGIHYVLLGKEGAYWTIRYTQLILFALSCLLIALTILNFTGNKKWAYTVGWTYAFSPFIPLYTYFIVTEAVSSFWVIMILFLASLYHKHKEKKYLYLSGLAVAVLFLSRPVMGVMLPAVFLSIVSFKKLFQFDMEYIKKVFLEGVIYGLGFATLVAPWVIRNYFVTGGKVVVAETFYHEAPMNFGKAHFYFRTLNSGWMNTGSGKMELLSHHLKYHCAANELNEEAKSTIENYLKEIPPYVFDIIPRKELQEVVYDIYECYVTTDKYQQEHPESNRADWITLACQDEAKAKVLKMIKKYKSEAALKYYLITPLKGLMRFSIQSNTHHISSLNPKDRNFAFWQKAIKGLCLLLNVILLASLFLFFFTKAPSNLKIIFGVALVITLLAVVWGVRHLENRYLIPFIPIAHITLAYFISNGWDWFQNRKNA